MTHLNLVADNTNIPPVSHLEISREMDRRFYRRIALGLILGCIGVLGLLMLLSPPDFIR